MTVTVETKFNVGDTVYIADNYYDFYANQTPCIVKDVLIDVNRRRTCISYEVEQEDFTYMVPESWMFATYEECEKWCEKQNGGAKNG
jgi:hypothetical protein